MLRSIGWNLWIWILYSKFVYGYTYKNDAVLSLISISVKHIDGLDIE